MIGFFSFDMMKELEGQRDRIAQALGRRDVQIERRGSSKDHAVVRCSDISLLFWRDRNHVIFCEIEFPVGVTGSTLKTVGVDMAAKFADLPQRTFVEDHDGKAIEKPAEQISQELRILTEITANVLFDSAGRRLLAAFDDGYTIAYNEWAAGDWDLDGDI